MSIGGRVDYARLAQLHRPRTEDGMRIAARELARQRLSDRDIAQALQVDVAEVRRLLAQGKS